MLLKSAFSKSMPVAVLSHRLILMCLSLILIACEDLNEDDITTDDDSSVVISVQVQGDGRVTSSPSGINCGSSCNAAFEKDSGMIELNAEPAENYIFSKWQGDCEGQLCSVDSSDSHNVTAIFSQENEDWQLSTSKLDFVGIVNGANLSAKSLKLVNSGAASIRYNISGVPDWLTVNRENGEVEKDSSIDIEFQPDNCTVSGREDASVTLSSETLSKTVSISRVCGNSANIDFALERFYITQAVPAMDSQSSQNKQISLVINRQGVARAFVSANKSTDLVPSVVLNYRLPNGKTGSIDFTSKNSLSQVVREGQWDDTFNLPLEKEFFVKGLEVYIEVDPDNQFAEIDETNNRFPTSGYASPKMKLGDTLELTIVPITLAGIPVKDSSMKKIESYVENTWKMFPFSEIDVNIHTPINVPGDASGDLDKSYDNWIRMLRYLDDLQLSEGSSRVYAGVTEGSLATNGIGGMAYLGSLVSVSTFDPDTFSHEIGHSFNVPHAPCGGVGNPDRRYPYPKGQIGSWGYDMVEGKLKAPTTTFDLMGYCLNIWISDYNYENIIGFRELLLSEKNMRQAKREIQNVLVVSGVLELGKVSIDTVFSLNTRVVNTADGNFLLKGVDKDGNELFKKSFGLLKLSHSTSRHFSLSVAVEELLMDKLEYLEVSLNGRVLYKGKGGVSNTVASTQDTAKKFKQTQANRLENAVNMTEIIWDTSAYHAILVRDPINNEVLGKDKSGRLLVQPQSHIVEVIYSNGLNSHSEMVTIQ